MVDPAAPDKTGMEDTNTASDTKTDDTKATGEAKPAKDTILIAEDSLPNQKILQHLLVKLEFDVIACNNGTEAWAKLNDPETKKIVGVFSDMMMPELDGLS